MTGIKINEKWLSRTFKKSSYCVQHGVNGAFLCQNQPFFIFFLNLLVFFFFLKLHLLTVIKNSTKMTIFGSSNAEIQKNHKIIQNEVNWLFFIFQGNFDYAQKSFLWTFFWYIIDMFYIYCFIALFFLIIVLLEPGSIVTPLTQDVN